MKKNHSHHETEEPAHKHGHPQPPANAAPSGPASPDPAAAQTPPPADKPAEEGLEQRLLRLQADFANFRKRVERDKETWSHQAVENLVKELIPVLDHFEIGLKSAIEKKTEASVLDGFKLVQEQLLRALEKAGLQAIDATGRVFNPHQHEAITHLPSAEHAADMVSLQTRRGYEMKGKLLRPAQVIVSSGRPQAPAKDADAPGEEG